MNSRPTPKPKPAASKPTTDGGTGAVTVVTHTVRDIAHVIPGWVKALMLALGALLLVAALLIVAAGIRNRRLRRLSVRLLDEVGVLSAALLPEVPRQVGALAVSVAYRPAEGLAAGGDFYDVFPLDGGSVGIVVGDVSGHGREALGPATLVRHMVRSYLEAGLPPREALGLAGKVLEDHGGDEEFATAVAAVHDPGAGTLAYASAGHPPPIVRGHGAHRPVTAAASPPLGIGKRTGLRQTTIAVDRGTTLCFFTDGLLEARRGERILGEPALERLVTEAGVEATAEQIVARVARETDAMPDDVAACVIRVEGGASGSTMRVEELEIGPEDFDPARSARFLDACGVETETARRTLEVVSRTAGSGGGLVVRVRIAEGGPSVDTLPTGGVPALAPVRALTA